MQAHDLPLLGHLEVQKVRELNASVKAVIWYRVTSCSRVVSCQPRGGNPCQRIPLNLEEIYFSEMLITVTLVCITHRMTALLQPPLAGRQPSISFSVALTNEQRTYALATWLTVGTRIAV
jgi:hypothetical protein